MNLRIFDNEDLLAEAAAAFVSDAAQKAIGARGRFSIALSGGSTPAALFKKLAKPPTSTIVDWGNVFVFWSDERTVPPENLESNFRLAHDVLLQHVPIPSQNIHRLKGELTLDQAVEAANKELAVHFGEGKSPQFDLVLLGLGHDGHTASLFPGSAALDTLGAGVVANYVEELATWRITFSLPLINIAKQILFLVTGEHKAEMVRQVIDERNLELPVSRVSPQSGQVAWYLDAAAASKLSGQAFSN